MMNNKMFAWVQCSLTAGEPQLFNGSSSFAICDAFEWLVVKLVGINYHTVWNHDRKLRSESQAASETQKSSVGFFFLYDFVPCCFIISHWSWALLHHDYSCAVWSRLFTADPQDKWLHILSFDSGCFSPLTPVIETFISEEKVSIL